jgi:hypothetical protein
MAMQGAMQTSDIRGSGMQGPAHGDADQYAMGLDVRRLSTGLGWFSLALGAAALCAPRQVIRMAGVGDTAATRTLVRLVGVREIGSGLGILSRPRPSGFLWSRVTGDAMDSSSWAPRSPRPARGGPGWRSPPRPWPG